MRNFVLLLILTIPALLVAEEFALNAYPPEVRVGEKVRLKPRPDDPVSRYRFTAAQVSPPMACTEKTFEIPSEGSAAIWQPERNGTYRLTVTAIRRDDRNRPTASATVKVLPRRAKLELVTNYSKVLPADQDPPFPPGARYKWTRMMRVSQTTLPTSALVASSQETTTPAAGWPPAQPGQVLVSLAVVVTHPTECGSVAIASYPPLQN